MLSYIKQTPEQIGKNIERADELTRPMTAEYLKQPRRTVWIIACGSSANAALCARPFMMRYLHNDVKVVPPTTFVIGEHDLHDDDFAFVVSQSGCSTNSIRALDVLREKGVRAIGLTGNVDSDFKDHADVVVDFGVGEEGVGYVTKGVVTLAQYLMLFSVQIAADSRYIDASAQNSLMREMVEAPCRHETVQKETWEFFDRNERALTAMTVAFSCGFLQAYGIACEGALKMGETIQIPSFAYEAEEWIHGPNLQLTPNYTVFCIDHLLEGSDRLVDIYLAARQVTDRAFIVTNSRRVDEDHAVRLPFEIGEPLMTPLYVLPFYQIIAYQTTNRLSRWTKHPLFEDRFRDAISTKTDSISRIMPYA